MYGNIYYLHVMLKITDHGNAHRKSSTEDDLSEKVLVGR
jgi:hypothetical protein